MFQKSHEISYDFVKQKILGERLVCIFGVIATICFLININLNNEILDIYLEHPRRAYRGLSYISILEKCINRGM